MWHSVAHSPSPHRHNLGLDSLFPYLTAVFFLKSSCFQSTRPINITGPEVLKDLPDLTTLGSCTSRGSGGHFIPLDAGGDRFHGVHRYSFSSNYLTDPSLTQQLRLWPLLPKYRARSRPIPARSRLPPVGPSTSHQGGFPVQRG